MSASEIFSWPIWIGLCTEDIDREVDFYVNTLGMPVKGQPQPGQGATFDFGGWQTLEIFPPSSDPFSVRPGYMIGYQYIGTEEGFLDACAELVDRGVVQVGPTSRHEDYAYAQFLDPGGHRFLLKWVNEASSS